MYIAPKGKTHNLLDYTTDATATNLRKYQWDYIHNPENIVGIFEDDSEGESGEMDDCWEDNHIKWVTETKQIYKNKKKLVYNASCTCRTYSLQRTYYRLIDGSILLMEEKQNEDNYNSEESIVIKYSLYNPYLKEWSEIKLDDYEDYCLKCELDTLITYYNEEVGIPTIKILVGVVAIVAVIPSGETSLGILPALGTSFGVISALYSTVDGVVELTLNLTNNKEWYNDIPHGYLNATVGLTIEYFDGNETRVETVKAVLDISEGVINLKVAETNIEKLDRAITAGKIIKISYDELSAK